MRRRSFLPTRSGIPPLNIYFEAVYENGIPMIVSNQEKMGVTFEGTNGKIYVNRGKLEAEPPSILDSKIGPEGIHLYSSDDHFRNFIDCVISREPDSSCPLKWRTARSRSATWATSPCG